MKKAPLVPALALALLAGCAAEGRKPDHEVQATRKDVTVSLYRQFDLVLARQKELATQPRNEAVVRERAELLHLAAEIAHRILRIDTEANGDKIIERIRASR